MSLVWAVHSTPLVRTVWHWCGVNGWIVSESPGGECELNGHTPAGEELVQGEDGTTASCHLVVATLKFWLRVQMTFNFLEKLEIRVS